MRAVYSWTVSGHLKNISLNLQALLGNRCATIILQSNGTLCCPREVIKQMCLYATWCCTLCYSLSYYLYLFMLCGPGSSVGIATDYGLDGPGSNPGGDEIFCLSRPALGPTQPPVKGVPVLSRR